eukprot:2858481-Rhodomonas_salina.1
MRWPEKRPRNSMRRYATNASGSICPPHTLPQRPHCTTRCSVSACSFREKKTACEARRGTDEASLGVAPRCNPPPHLHRQRGITVCEGSRSARDHGLRGITVCEGSRSAKDHGQREITVREGSRTGRRVRRGSVLRASPS